MKNYLDSFTSYMQNEQMLSSLTVAAYRRDVEQWVQWLTEGKSDQLDPLSVSTSDIRVWLAEESRRGVSPRSLRRKTQSLRAFFRYMIKTHGLKVNPAQDVVLAKSSKPLPSFVPEAEMDELLKKNYEGNSDFELKRNHLILLMLYSTGMRRAELRDLRDEDIDLNRSELKVLGKRNKERMIPFGKELSDSITEYLQERTRAGHRRAERFFIRPGGEPLYDKLIYNIVHNAMLKSGVHATRMSPHVMRHSFATDMLNNGALLNAVQHLLGHESLATTQVYTHVTYRELQQNYKLAHPRAKK